MLDVIRSRWVLAVPFVSVGLLFVLFTQTSPQEGGPASILLVFLLLYVFFASCLFILLHAGESITRAIIGEERIGRIPKWRLEVKRAYYLASIIAFVPVVLLAMQSLGQLQIRDILLVSALTVLVSFYVLRITR